MASPHDGSTPSYALGNVAAMPSALGWDGGEGDEPGSGGYRQFGDASGLWAAHPTGPGAWQGCGGAPSWPAAAQVLTPLPASAAFCGAPALCAPPRGDAAELAADAPAFTPSFSPAPRLAAMSATAGEWKPPPSAPAAPPPPAALGGGEWSSWSSRSSSSGDDAPRDDGGAERAAAAAPPDQDARRRARADAERRREDAFAAAALSAPAPPRGARGARRRDDADRSARGAAPRGVARGGRPERRSAQDRARARFDAAGSAERAAAASATASRTEAKLAARRRARDAELGRPADRRRGPAPPREAIELNKLYAALSSVDDVLALYASRPCVNDVNVATAFTRLARAAPVDGARARGDGRFRDLCAEAAARIEDPAPSACGPQSLANVAHSLAKLAVGGSDAEERLWAAVQARSLERTEAFSAREAVNVAYAFATARRGDAGLFDALRDLVLLYAPTLNSQEVSIASWSFSSAGYYDAELFAALAQRALPLLHTFNE